MENKNKEIINYARGVIVANLKYKNYDREAMLVATDYDNELLLDHIKRILLMLKKAKEIIEKELVSNDKGI